MSHVFVISEIEDNTAEKEAHLAWENKAVGYNIILSVTHDSAGSGYLKDGLTTNAWKPNSTSSTASFNALLAGDVNCIGVLGVNWSSANVSVSIDDNGTPLTAASGLRDNQPLFIVFPTISGPLLNFVFTSSANIEVGEIFFGETLRLPRNVSIGYSPGRWDFAYKSTTSKTEGNQFGRSTLRAKATTEKFNVDFVENDWMESEYVSFIHGAAGKPVFFAWSDKSVNYGVYGHWSPSKPEFTSSFYSAISLEIMGVS